MQADSTLGHTTSAKALPHDPSHEVPEEDDGANRQGVGAGLQNDRADPLRGFGPCAPAASVRSATACRRRRRASVPGEQAGRRDALFDHARRHPRRNRLDPARPGLRNAGVENVSRQHEAARRHHRQAAGPEQRCVGRAACLGTAGRRHRRRKRTVERPRRRLGNAPPRRDLLQPCADAVRPVRGEALHCASGASGARNDP